MARGTPSSASRLPPLATSWSRASAQMPSALRPGMDRRCCRRVDGEELAVVGDGLRGRQDGDRLGRGRARGHEVEAAGAERGVGDVLAGDRADAGAGVGAAGGDRRARTRRRRRRSMPVFAAAGDEGEGHVRRSRARAGTRARNAHLNSSRAGLCARPCLQDGEPARTARRALPQRPDRASARSAPAPPQAGASRPPGRALTFAPGAGVATRHRSIRDHGGGGGQ